MSIYIQLQLLAYNWEGILSDAYVYASLELLVEYSSTTFVSIYLKLEVKE